MTRENKAKLLVDRILAHPGLEERVEAILDIVENTSGELITADQAEGKVIEEVHKLGRELLKEWVSQRYEKAIETVKSTHPNARGYEKELYWQSTFGKIEIEEIVMKVANERLLPFSFFFLKRQCISHPIDLLK
jgi:hypothetical protein